MSKGVSFPKKQLAVITGLAGSGKTTAIHALEDLGYTCIDNLPSVLLDQFIEALQNNSIQSNSIALALDSRDANLAEGLKKISQQISNNFFEIKILFLYATDETIIRRFQETRRRHPLSLTEETSEMKHLLEAIQRDKSILMPFQKIADEAIDTTQMTKQYLSNLIKRHYNFFSTKDELKVLLVSFGFKYGLPADMDMILDVRCFANPYYEDNLRSLTGLDSRVESYVFANGQAQVFVEKTTDLIKFLYPLFIDEGKSYFSIGIGCTGGKHRSVAIVEKIAHELKELNTSIRVEHRHVDKK